MAALVDTNVLVYRYDARDPEKQRRAREVLRRGILEDSVRISYQSIIEFYAVVTRSTARLRRLLDPADGARETEEILWQFPVFYPNAETIRLGLRGAATYQLSWFDALIWAIAEQHAIELLISEDFEHGRRYGGVTAMNPFLE
ncbi:MAG TPA: PIN domain-containing protein [Thermoanaerobaculia bacterium]|nr:PIN domain-containing protein [Thermoanaerobaculia bacterium]